MQNNIRPNVRQKSATRGRPPSTIPTRPVTVRLPVAWLEAFERGKGKTAEIEARLFRTIEIDQVEPHFRVLAGKMEEIAKRVRRSYRADWFADRNAHAAFIAALRCMIDDVAATAPADAAVPPTTLAPEIVGAEIYRNFAAEIIEYEQSSKDAQS